MLAIIAKIGALIAATPYSIWWGLDEAECPKSLIK